MLFISYKSEDISIAEQVKSQLEKGGFECWMAPGSIPIGESYMRSISQAISSSEATVLVLTDKAMQSPWITREIGTTISEGKNIYPVIPQVVELTEEYRFMLHNVQMPISGTPLDETVKNTSKKIRSDLYAAKRSSSDIGDTSGEEWGPERRTYTMKQRPSYRVFNSIVDNPDMGDERTFVTVRNYSKNGVFSRETELIPGDEYEVSIYFHNNGIEELNHTGTQIAANTRLFLSIPERIKAGQRAVAKGRITAGNTDPGEVWAKAYLKFASNDVSSMVFLRFVPNSVILHTNTDVNGTILSGKALFGETGVYVAVLNDAWGVIPSGLKFAGSVTLRLKADYVKFYSELHIRNEDGKAIEETNTTEGELLLGELKYYNLGTMIQNNVTAHITLPDSYEYIPGSVKVKTNTSQGAVKVSDKLFGEGLNIGGYRGGDSASIEFTIRQKDFAGRGDVIMESSIATMNGTITSRKKLK